MADAELNLMPLIVGCGAGVLSASALYAYTIFSPRSQFWAPVIRSLPQREAVALTFNDGPHPQVTPRVLDILAARGLKATFFVIGKNAQAHPELLKRIHAEGHGIGNHTFDHAPFALRDELYWQRQIEKTQETVGAITGTLPVLFRPPGGYKTRTLAAAAKAAHLPIVGWSVRAGVDPRAGERLLRRTAGHDIVLLHDGVPPRQTLSRDYTAELLPAYLTGLVEKKLQIVSLVDALLAASSGIRAGIEKTRTRSAES